MSRYRRYRSDGGGNKALWVIVIAIICAVCVVLGVVFHSEIGAWGKKVKDKVTDDKKAENTLTDAEEEKFHFTRAILRYNETNAAAGTLSMQYEFFMDETYDFEIRSAENKKIVMTTYTYDLFSEVEASEGGLKADLEKRFESGHWKFDTLNSFTPDRFVDEYGALRNVCRVYTTPSYSNYNTRYVPVAFVAEETEDGVVCEPATYNGKSYKDVTVSPSIVYLASEHLNASMRYSRPINAELVTLCKTYVAKGVAQSKGIALSAFVESENQLTVDTSEVFEVKVGETKALPVSLEPNILVAIEYIGGENTYTDYYEDYMITGDGMLTGVSVGEYSVMIIMQGQRYSLKIKVVE